MDLINSGGVSVSYSSSGTLLDFSQINFVQTCERDNYYSSSGTLETYVQQCYSPFQTFWVLYALGIGMFALTYWIVCLIKGRLK